MEAELPKVLIITQHWNGERARVKDLKQPCEVWSYGDRKFTEPWLIDRDGWRTQPRPHTADEEGERDASSHWEKSYRTSRKRQQQELLVSNHRYTPLWEGKKKKSYTENVSKCLHTHTNSFRTIYSDQTKQLWGNHSACVWGKKDEGLGRSWDLSRTRCVWTQKHHATGQTVHDTSLKDTWTGWNDSSQNQQVWTTFFRILKKRKTKHAAVSFSNPKHFQL